MSLERGFRRVTIVLSCVGLCAGLGVTAYETAVAYSYISTIKILGKDPCFDEVVGRLITEADDVRVLQDKNPTVEIPRARDRYYVECRRARLTPLLYSANEAWRAIRAGRAIDALLPATGPGEDWSRRAWLHGYPEQGPSYKFVVLTVIWGVCASAVLSVLPWGVFYLLRWIVVGFRT